MEGSHRAGPRITIKGAVRDTRTTRIPPHRDQIQNMAVYELIKAADEGSAAAAADPNHKAISVAVDSDDDGVLQSALRDLENGAGKGVVPPGKTESPALKRATRLVSLDVFRGLTVAVRSTLAASV